MLAQPATLEENEEATSPFTNRICCIDVALIIALRYYSKCTNMRACKVVAVAKEFREYVTSRDIFFCATAKFRIYFYRLVIKVCSTTMITSKTEYERIT